MAYRLALPPSNLLRSCCQCILICTTTIFPERLLHENEYAGDGHADPNGEKPESSAPGQVSRQNTTEDRAFSLLVSDQSDIPDRKHTERWSKHWSRIVDTEFCSALMNIVNVC